MGYTTDFVGHIDIDPPLNAGEIAYLETFRHMRHFDRGGSPYDVPGNPLAPDSAGVSTDRYNRTADLKPQLYCQWAACGEGCCLSWDGQEKFYAPVAWLRYLVEHLLGPGAVASGSGHPLLAPFTFDHRLDGMIVGCRRDTRELFAITVSDNEVDSVVLRHGDPQPWETLGYQEAADRDQAARSRRRADSPAALSARNGAGQVVGLAAIRPSV